MEEVLEKIKEQLKSIRKGRKDLTEKMEGDLVVYPDLDISHFYLLFAYWDGMVQGLENTRRLVRKSMKSALVRPKQKGKDGAHE